MIAAELRGGNKPSLNEALGWIGSRVDDIYGANVGRLEDVWIDPGTGVPRWLLVKEGRFGGRTTLIPFEDATAGAGHVWVPYEREIVRDAPEIEPGAPLTHQVEAALRSHYSANAPTAISHRGQPAPEPTGGQTSSATIRLHGSPGAERPPEPGFDARGDRLSSPQEQRPPAQPRPQVLREQPPPQPEPRRPQPQDPSAALPPMQLPPRPAPPIAAPGEYPQSPPQQAYRPRPGYQHHPPAAEPPPAYEPPPAPAQQPPAYHPPAQQQQAYEPPAQQQQPAYEPAPAQRQQPAYEPQPLEYQPQQRSGQQGEASPPPAYAPSSQPRPPEAPAQRSSIEGLQELADSTDVHYVDIELIGELSIRGELRSVRVVPRDPRHP